MDYPQMSTIAKALPILLDKIYEVFFAYDVNDPFNLFY